MRTSRPAAVCTCLPMKDGDEHLTCPIHAPLPPHEPECPWTDGDPTRCTCPPLSEPGRAENCTEVGR